MFSGVFSLLEAVETGWSEGDSDGLFGLCSGQQLGQRESETLPMEVGSLVLEGVRLRRTFRVKNKPVESS
ncbi:hypothetical protein FHS27_000065 [Rhodopirellula rubra]|uniref:Uncharacterized protein n=1 Tax=Aporhodopirellula rubra TaxID=980271 RepID=A0A7W5DTL2_9BACT|nr:hypothetical protein [Aporhodopirellula rubra]